MDLTLPQRMYLLMYTVEKEKFEARNLQFRGQRVWAAALARLFHSGHVRLEGGRRPRVLRGGDGAPQDSFLREVWERLPERKPAKWLDVLHPHAHTAESSVRAQLAAAGAITVPPRRGVKRLSLLAQHEVVVHHPETVTALLAEARRPLVARLDPAALTAEELAMTAIAAERDLYHVFPRDERRAHKAELKALRDRFDASVPGLRKALATSIDALRPSGGGWGR